MIGDFQRSSNSKVLKINSDFAGGDVVEVDTTGRRSKVFRLTDYRGHP